jgi:hypothetical protein
MNGRLYTNTGKIGSVMGLLVTTVLVTYVSTHSTEIVDGALSLTRKGLEKVEGLVRGKKLLYRVCKQDIDGKLYDTGKRVWK